jgi:uncharacterized protein YjbI with pentapeptide repeats
MQDVDLGNAILMLADLSESDLRDANFRDADLRFADLTEANLEDARGLDDASLGGVIWKETTCPTGHDSDDLSGDTCLNHLR